MQRVLITGFTPFDGRQANASWLLASSLAGLVEDAMAVCIDVVWDAPLVTLAPIIKETSPDYILAFGEGRDGWFDIEEKARNHRLPRADNQGQMPDKPLIDPSGPAVLHSNYNIHRLQRGLRDAGYPARVSRDAGQFLCEETFYCLLAHSTINSRCQALFCHVPPFLTTASIKGHSAQFDSSAIDTCARDIRQLLF